MFGRRHGHSRHQQHQTFSYRIDPAKCRGCGKCARVCSEGAVSGEPKQAYMIDQTLCRGCGSCWNRCRHEAIIRQKR